MNLKLSEETDLTVVANTSAYTNALKLSRVRQNLISKTTKKNSSKAEITH